MIAAISHTCKNVLLKVLRKRRISGVSSDALRQYADLLGTVAQDMQVLVDPPITPLQNSPASVELQAARESSCGEEPLREAYRIAIMNYHAVIDRAKAMTILMTGVVTAIPLADIVRPLAESASQAWWLLEPDIGPLNRVRRLQALRYRSAVEGEKTAKADGLPPDEYHDYTETKVQVERDSQRWGLEAPFVDRKPWVVYVCGDQQLPTASHRVKAMFAAADVPSVYPLFSGYSHSEIYALWREFELSADESLGTVYKPILNEKSFEGITAIAIYALFPPAERLSMLYGLVDFGKQSTVGEPGH